MITMISSTPRHSKKANHLGSMDKIDAEAPEVGRLMTRRVSLPALFVDGSSPGEFQNYRRPLRRPAQTLPEKELLETTKRNTRMFREHNEIKPCNGDAKTPVRQPCECVEPASQETDPTFNKQLDEVIQEYSQSDEYSNVRLNQSRQGKKQSQKPGVIKLDLSLINNALPVASPGQDGNRNFKVKVILLGDNGVGKTSFLQTLINEKYTPVTSNLAMANVVKTIHYDGRQVDIDIHDTAGQEKYRSLTSSYYRNAHGCLVFFDVNNSLSFENVRQWLQDLKTFSTYDKLSVVLVGLRTKQSPFGSKYLKAEHRRHSYASIHSQTTNERAVPRKRAESFASSETIPYREVDLEVEQSVLDPVYRLLDSILLNAIIRTRAESQPNPIKPISLTKDTSVPNSKCCLNC